MKLHFTPYLIILLVVTASSFSCKKKEKKEYQTTFGTPATFTPDTIESFDEKNGNSRVYNVTLTHFEKFDSNSAETSTVLTTYTCSSVIIGDTIIAGNITARLYHFTFGNGFTNPIRAYSFYKDSLWQFFPVQYNQYLTNIAIKMPLTIGHTWKYKPVTLPNKDDYTTKKYTFDAGLARYGYLVSRADGNYTGNNEWSSSFFITQKGIQLFSYDYKYLNLSNGGYKIDRYELREISSNF